MSPMNETRGGDKRFWRSLDDLADTERFRRFVEREFPEDAERMMAPASRRGFMKLMGASMALAGMTGCRWPTEEILPFAHRPDGYVPGVPRFYATAMELNGVATGLLAKSYDGRPIKLEGNPEHPSSLGSTSAIAQAAILELYDPDRSRAVKHAGQRALGGWDEFVTFAHERFGALKADGGTGLRVVSEATSSPSVAEMRRRFETAYPHARWYEYEPLSRDNQREGSTLAFGAPHRTHLALDQAELVLSLDEDFVLDHPAAVRYARDHVTARNPDGGLESRLYMVESGFSVTGTMADDRIPLPAQLIPVAAGCFAAELFLEVGVSLPGISSELTRIFERFQFHPLYTDLDWSFAREFATRRGRCLIVAGPSQSPEGHALVHLMNHALGNVGKTVHYTVDPEPERPSHVTAIGHDAVTPIRGRDGDKNIVQTRGDRDSPHPGAGDLGLAIFLVSLTILFIGAVVGYWIVRRQAASWPPVDAPALPIGIWFSTAALFASGATMQLSLNAIRRGDQAGLRARLTWTLSLALLFVASQVANWISFARADSTFDSHLYSFTFYMLTGLHGLHVLGGLVALGYVRWRAQRGAYDWAGHSAVRYMAIYWHFLGVIWLLLFGLLVLDGLSPGAA